MSSLLFVVLALAAGLIALRYILTGDPARVAGTIRFVLGLVLGLLGLLISMRGGFVFGLPVVVYGMFMAARGLGWRGMPGLRLPGLGLPGAPPPGQGGSGPSSGVRTRYLDMTLDHHSGAMDVLIRDGAFQGRKLSELSRDEAMSFLREVRLADADSARLVETWLDREYPEWRDSGGSSDEPQDGGSGPMARAEALELLNLTGDPTPDEVREAYKREMKRHHPDQGGSDVAAAKLNQARDVLLGR